MVLRSHSFSFSSGQCADVAVAWVCMDTATIGVVQRHVLQKFLALMGLSRSLDVPDRVFSLFTTFDRLSALAETPRIKIS